MGFFEDIFCDEVLTELIAQKICIRLRPRARMDYGWALEYGFESAFEKIADILGFKLKTWNLGKDGRTSTLGAKKLREEMVSDLEKWFRSYMGHVRRGETSMLEGDAKY